MASFLAIPFFSCTPHSSVVRRESFLCQAQNTLSHCEYCLFLDILSEWECFPLLSSLLLKWNASKVPDTSSIVESIRIVSFNVRGFNLRHQEVLLLANSVNVDILILLEVGPFDRAYCGQIFDKYTILFQRGENTHGGVVMLVRVRIKHQRVPCNVPNVCVVDLTQDEKNPQRIMGLYAPESKSWMWEELSEFVTEDCSLFGDFNVDLEQDGEKAEGLLKWADSLSLAPYAPEAHTSLRSNRTIDYAFSTGNPISIQTYEGGTTSDHKPVIAIIESHYKENSFARNTHWRVFSLFCEFVYPFLGIKLASQPD
jgi:endonuclease/exonuclease/phosphatase (EEP) superfamily protein YafD